MTRNMDESRWVDAGPVLRQQWIEAEGPRQEDTAMSGCKEVVSSTTWDGLTAEMHKPYFGRAIGNGLKLVRQLKRSTETMQRARQRCSES